MTAVKKTKLKKLTGRRAGLGWRKYEVPLLRETDWAYIAGIIDGEGSILFQNSGKHKVVHLSISNTDLNVLEWIKNKLKEGTIYEKIRYSSNWKQCYVWRTAAHKVVYSILIKMLPYLKIKRDKAIKSITFIQNKEIKS